MKKTAVFICFCIILLCIGSFFYLQKPTDFTHYFKKDTVSPTPHVSNLADSGLRQDVPTVADAPNADHSATHLTEGTLPNPSEVLNLTSESVINQINSSHHKTALNQPPQSNHAPSRDFIPTNQSLSQNQYADNSSDLRIQNKAHATSSEEAVATGKNTIQTRSPFTAQPAENSQNSALNIPAPTHQIHTATSAIHQSTSADKSNSPLILTQLEIDSSEVLPSVFLSKVRQRYEGEDLTIPLIKEIINKINAEYQKKGYLTCKAYVQPQNIQNGVLKISLFEGKTGTLKLNDSPLLRTAYIKTFLNIPEGKVLNVSDLESRILLYNAVNENKMRLSLQPSQKVGHTDIEGVVNPADRFSISVFTDNAGQKETGYYRYGFFSNLKNIIPVDTLKDQFNFGGIQSTGSNAFFGSYSITEPWLKTTWTLGMDWSDTDIIGGDLRGLSIEGDFYNYYLSVKRPILVTTDSVTNLSLSGNLKSGATFISDFKTQEINTDTATIALDNFYLFSNGYLYTVISATNAMHIRQGNTHFQHYNWLGEGDIGFGNGWGFNLKGRAQLSYDDFLPSSDQMQVGGINSVRGYPEGMLVGDQGVVLMSELRKEWRSPFKYAEKIKGFTFFDVGKAWSSESGTLENKNEAYIYSSGVGLGFDLFNRVTANFTLAFPLKKHEFNNNRSALEGMRGLFYIQSKLW